MTEPRPLRADARRNRARLVEVATGVFAVEGLGVPLDEIARRAGVGAGTLYRHFPTKEALIEAIVHHRLVALTEFARALRTSTDSGDALFQLIDRIVVDAATKRDLVEALTSAGVELGEAVTAAAAALHAEIAHLLRRAQRRGDIRKDIAAPEMIALISGILSALQPRPDRQPDARLIMTIMRDGLQPH